MSSTSTPRSTGPKVMTSRLMNMKFMQRAAASSPLSSTPAQTPDAHSAKRQKLSNVAATPTSTGASTPTPIADEDSSKLPWNAAGETEWVLALPQPVTNGSKETAESSDEDEVWSSVRSIGRQTYGSFKRRKSTMTNTTTNGEEELSAPESGEEEDMHPLRPMKQPRDREREEAEQGRRLDRMDLGRMGGVSGSSAMTGAGMSKRKHGDGGKFRGKDKQRNNGGPHRGAGNARGAKNRKPM